MANRKPAVRELRDLLIQISLFWVLIAIGIQFGFPDVSRIFVIVSVLFSFILLLFGEGFLRFLATT